MGAKTAAELVVDVTSTVDDATSGFDAVGSSAKGMSRAVEEAGDTAERTGRQIGISAEAADDLGGKAGKATGALGALSSGFELVGAEKYAGALQAAGMATDFMSGVGDSLNLVMESTAVKTTIAKVQMVGHAIASGASAAATGVMTAAQWALNAAMSANPIALVVIAVVALVAAVVIAYQKSETFRNIVTGAFSAVENAAKAAFGWVKDNWPLLLAIITGPIGLAVLALVSKWEAIQTAASNTKKWITDRIGEIPALIRGVASDIGDILTAPFTTVGNAVQHVLDLIGRIKLPKINLPGLRVAGGAPELLYPTASTSVAPTSTTQVYITVQGAIDPYSTAAQIRELLTREGMAFPS